MQARIGNVHAPETTVKLIVATFEHDTARPVDGYAAPQLHTHAVTFYVTERDNGQTRALQPQELFASQRYATSVYRSELVGEVARVWVTSWSAASMGSRRSKAIRNEYRMLPVRAGSRQKDFASCN